MTIIHDTKAHKFMAIVDEHQAVMAYRVLLNKILSFEHTYVPDALRGQGVAKALMLYVIDYVREAGYKIRPVYEYAKGYFAKHKELEDILL